MARRVEIHCFSRAGYGLEATTGTWSRFPRTVDAAKGEWVGKQERSGRWISGLQAGGRLRPEP